MCRRSDRACRPARGHERGLCNNMLERMQSIGKQGCPGGCKATDGGWEVCGARGARGTSPPRAISASPPTVGRARTVVANPRNRDSHGGGKLRNLFADYVHPPPSTDLSVCTHHSHVSKTIKPRGTFTARQNDHIALTPRLRLRRRGCTPRTWDRQAGKAGWVTGRLRGCSMPVSCVILVLTHPRREAAVPFCDIKRGHDKPTRVLIMPVP